MKKRNKLGKKKGAKNKSGKKQKNKSKKALRVKPIKVEPEPPPPPPPPPSQGEFIWIHIGQAGVQIGLACWELFCLEHGINPDGTVKELTTNSTSMFSLSQENSYVPRALIVDTEPSVIDVLKSGKFQNLFSHENMISGKESAASNYAAGFYGVGKTLSSKVMDQLARLAEDCNSLQGIAVFRSISGGTGSGMGSRIIETIRNTYPNKTIIDLNVCSSSEFSDIIVEPYNTALTTHHVLDVVNCSLLFDNKSIYDICGSKLDLLQPTFANINSIVALVTSGITSSLRFEGSMMRNISELLANLIPQPRLHFPLISYAPITNCARSISSASTQSAMMSFDSDYQMIKIDPRLGKYLSICMMFRGNLKPTNINTTIAFLQREKTIPVTHNMNSPLFKFGLCNLLPIAVPESGIFAASTATTTLCNNTIIKQYWMNTMNNYNKLLTKRVFLHHYTEEGMDEATFHTANGNISKLIAEYEEIESS
ncbi:tubulin alpha-2 chain [Acyrthosiphon pisum]|uniref:Tubulin alpha chain n=1 Tax=Acyrthosiphon pisum TaxID=7029 RepID=A0A8R2FB05_ACYPI|nr:tubulin alpha-2 chain [Acyrthosiphon pisum]|eukprot:XP_008186957.1 PREDICTED: tubulin alpha-2 chain isoform X1 [Acyrthosiphon pisum]